jgi:hypothetical protein
MLNRQGTSTELPFLSVAVVKELAVVPIKWNTQRRHHVYYPLHVNEHVIPATM